MHMKTTKKSSSHAGVGFGLLAGALLGAAAAVYASSKDGKKMTKAMEAKAKKLQTKLMKEIGNAETMSKENYTKIVDHVMQAYAVGKDELPALRTFLMAKWSDVQKQIKKMK